MKNISVLVLCLSGLALIELSCSASVSPLLDRVNVDRYLRNTRAVKQQIKCILKNGPCDAVGKEIKRLMPMVAKDKFECDECSETQIQKIKKIINHLKENYPEEWAEGIEKFGVSEQNLNL